MNTKLMIAFFTLFSFFGCNANAQKSVKDKELLSVNYHRYGMRIDDNNKITVSKTDDGYIAEQSGGYPQITDTFNITQADFDKLADIVLQMKRPIKKNSSLVHDLSINFYIEYKENGKRVTLDYTLGDKLDKKTTEFYRQAVELMEEFVATSETKNSNN